MRTLIVGAGRLGRALAEELLAAGHDVRLLDREAPRIAHLSQALRDRSVQASPLERDALADALAGCDGVAAATGDDALNAVVALAARRELGVPVAVAVIGNSARAEALSGLGIHVHCPTTRTARALHEALARSELERELDLGPGAAVYRADLPERLAGRALRELGHTGALVPVAVRRGGRVLLADPDLTLEPGDVLHVAAADPTIVADLMHP
jgi:trk system potassium uptake protein TrkA